MQILRKLVLIVVSYWFAMVIIFPGMVVVMTLAALFFQPDLGTYLLLVLGCFVATIVLVAFGALRVTGVSSGKDLNGFEIGGE